MNIAANADAHAQLAKGALVHVHQSGLAVQAIPSVAMRLINRHLGPEGFRGAPARSWAAIKQGRTPGGQRRVDDAIRALEVLSTVVARGLCQEPLSGDFVNLVLSGNYRTDTVVDVGHTVATQGGADGAFASRPAAVVAWGTADEQDTIDARETRAIPARVRPHFENGVTLRLETNNSSSELNKLVRAGRVAELDLVCAAGENNQHFWKKRGSARALLIHTLATIGRRRKAGGRRYSAVVTHAITRRSDDRMPLRGALGALGFVAVPSWFVAPSGDAVPTGRNYFLLRDVGGRAWARRVAQAVLTGPCPTHAGATGTCR